MWGAEDVPQVSAKRMKCSEKSLMILGQTVW